MSSFEKFQRTLVVLLIALGTFSAGYYFGKRGFDVEVVKNPPAVNFVNRYPPDQNIDFGLFWEVYKIVSSSYLERPVNAQKLVYGAIKGMVASLDDPYTSFLPPQDNESINNALNGKYEGIGAELGLVDGQLIIVAPLDGSPAKASGIRSGDKIYAIDGTSTVGVTLVEAVSKIRGPANTTVVLKIGRDDVEQPIDMSITRGEITIDSVSWEDKGDGVAYIRISRFGGETNNEWDKVVSEINVKMQNLNGIVVDVRGNPGGYLLSAVHISGEFFRDKPVLFEEDALKNQIPRTTTRVGAFEGVPVYVLIDGGSASASEILSAALKHNINAVLVGQKSFGKGTIQDAKDFEDGSGIHITIAKWLTPAKEWVHKVGIDPDVVVEITKEDIENKNDTQLNKALDFAQGREVFTKKND
ncbi:MAG: S41 family peptidase [Patescibacteria group bacterium]|uniref:S41 family peptidase n=1 Tax=candidate division WWE3 bacterium TaxID=2053526 RepID=A0A955EAJ1_UNCKA|nr:S41 family peptidase [candidate division WWE3 bacterium]